MEEYKNKVINLLMMTYLLLFSWQEVFALVDSPDLILVSADYTYYAPPSVGVDEAKMNALNRAKLQAIADHFGTVIQQNNTTTISNTGDNSYVRFLSQLESEIRGEWIETVGSPEYQVWYDDGLIIKVKVKGYIRQINETQTDFDIKILCNGVSNKFERTEFHDGDDLFVKFTSPIDGYIAVYLSDSDNVYCLLPYPEDSGHASPVKGGVTRILFSYEYNEANESVRQYHLTCANKLETNFLYVIFSVHRFDKAIDAEKDILLPRQLTVEQFQKWLSSCRRRDKQFQVREYTLTIIK